MLAWTRPRRVMATLAPPDEEAMRALTLIVLVALPALTQAGTRTVAVARDPNGTELVFAPAAQKKVAGLALALLQTASYEAPRAIATERWKGTRQAPHVRVTFRPPRTVIGRFSTTGPAAAHAVQVDELMISISGDYPDYVLVRERGTVRAFSKYQPRQAQRLRGALDARVGKE